MNVLYVGKQYAGGSQENGHSYEHNNFYQCLVQMGLEVCYFDAVQQQRRRGTAWVSRRLTEVVKSIKPDLMFAVVTNDELDPRAVREITTSGVTRTVNWFCDDHHRFDKFSRHWAPCFDLVVTTAHSVLPKYAAAGITNVLASQWACNPFLQRKLELPLKYDLTFIGTLHGNRRALIQALRSRGLRVHVWGPNTPRGPLSDPQLVEVLNQTRINLNFSGASVAVGDPTARPRRFRETARRIVRATPIVANWARTSQRRRFGKNLPDEQIEHALATRYVAQIKGRNFEVPGCGAFQLTGRVENIDDYFVPGHEIALYDDFESIVRQAKHYLEHEEERLAVADAGYRRCRREHTYVHRFNRVFASLGLPVVDAVPESADHLSDVGKVA